MKKLVNQVINEIFRQMTITLTLALDVPVRPMDVKGLSDISNEQRTTFSPAEPSGAGRERMSAMSSQSSPSESYRSEYLGLTGEDMRERGTINPR